MFAALGDPTRLVLLHRLADGQERSIASLSTDSALTRQAVTKHLAVLEATGFVGRQRRGRETRFKFKPHSIREAAAYLQAVSGQWDDALARLQAHLEGNGAAATGR
ncbi:metalloregulator ArsR/SmtB family transcription factor [Aurantimonas sp. MSK8Z-1]|uniref:ArsR/SmtB family transcription factor n=1 Tax=Mangrovibrevibacter kandeliae TaxID=2968473 RepID=UPI0021178DE3|nr:metalloregulator ArsR/SmtB family transcription factor [Aurantimonas sp. MSK8Z-1]MCW4116215.1 metalloregulator ArsR/SmtB family transcription factor [Aurantimonas sp. MSK8Z-1]